MDELEILVRDTLREHSAGAPGTSGLVLRHRPRSAAVAIAASVAAAAAVVAIVLAVQPGRAGHGAPPAGPAATGTAPTRVTDTPPPAGYVWASYHGIEIAVPAGAQWIYLTCRLPTTSYVDFVLPGLAMSCPPRLPGQSDAPDPDAVAVSVTPTGMDVAAVGDAQDRMGSRTIADPGVSVAVTAPTQAQVELILGSIRITPVDRLGCRDHLTTTTPSNPPAESIVPTGPRSAVVCSYVPMGADRVYWLVGSHALDQSQAAELTARFQGLPGARTPSTGRSTPAVDWVVFDYATTTRTVAVQRWLDPPRVTDGQRTVAGSAAQDPPMPDI